MDRAYSTLEIKAVDDDARIITGIASTPTPDRVDDIVEPEGAQFKLPIPLLWQHRHDMPIGHVTEAKVTAEGINIVAEIAKGVTEDIERAWALIKARLVRGFSIGFRGLERADIEGSWGYRFTKWEWLELSAVTIPANADASIQTVKQFADRDALTDKNFPALEPGKPSPTDNLSKTASGLYAPVVKLVDPARDRAKADFVIKKIH